MKMTQEMFEKMIWEILVGLDKDGYGPFGGSAAETATEVMAISYAIVWEGVSDYAGYKAHKSL